MAELSILRTITVQLLREPLAWLCAASLGLLWWGLEVFMPLGLSTGALHRSTAHYELAFFGGVAAQVMALGLCLKLRRTLAGWSAPRALLAHLIALTVVAALMASVVVIPAEVFQLWQFADFSAGPALAALTLGWVHLAAMAAVIPLRWPKATAEELAGGGGAIRDKLVGAAWIAFAAVVVPATQSGMTATGRAVLHLFDPGRVLRACLTGSAPEPWGWAAATLPILGWSLLALAVARAAAPPAH